MLSHEYCTLLQANRYSGRYPLVGQNSLNNALYLFINNLSTQLFTRDRANSYTINLPLCPIVVETCMKFTSCQKFQCSNCSTSHSRKHNASQWYMGSTVQQYRHSQPAVVFESTYIIMYLSCLIMHIGFRITNRHNYSLCILYVIYVLHITLTKYHVL